MFDYKELGVYGLAEFMVDEYKDYKGSRLMHHVRDIDACDIAYDMALMAQMNVGDYVFWAVRENGTMCATSEDTCKMLLAHYGHELNRVYKIELNYKGTYTVCTLDPEDEKKL